MGSRTRSGGVVVGGGVIINRNIYVRQSDHALNKVYLIGRRVNPSSHACNNLTPALVSRLSVLGTHRKSSASLTAKAVAVYPALGGSLSIRPPHVWGHFPPMACGCYGLCYYNKPYGIVSNPFLRVFFSPSIFF